MKPWEKYQQQNTDADSGDGGGQGPDGPWNKYRRSAGNDSGGGEAETNWLGVEKQDGDPTEIPSLGETIVRQAGLNTLPALAGIKSFAPGFQKGAQFTPGGPVPKTIGGLIGGTATSVGGSEIARYVQDYALDTADSAGLLPDFLSDEQRQADLEQRPDASFYSSLAPDLLALRPGMAGKADVLGGAAMGAGTEAGRQAFTDAEYDPLKIGTAAGWNAVVNTPNRFGQRLMGNQTLTGEPDPDAQADADYEGGSAADELDGQEYLDLVTRAQQAQQDSEAQAPEQVSERVAEVTGQNREPAMDDPQARAATESELADVFNQPDILRRQDIEGVDEDGNPILAENAQPARDARGRQATVETLASTRQAEQASQDLDMPLRDQDVELVAQDIEGGMDPREAVRTRAPQARQEAFRQAEARRQRRDADLAETDGTGRGRSFRPGDRAYNMNEEDGVLIMDAKRDKNGRLVGGRQVESTGEFTPKGAQLVRDVESGEVMEVSPSQLEQVSRPTAPRQEQDLRARARNRPEGVGTESPVPETRTDDIASRQLRAETPPREVEGEVEPGPGPEGGPQRGPDSPEPETAADVLEGRPTRINEVNNPPKDPPDRISSRLDDGPPEPRRGTPADPRGEATVGDDPEVSASAVSRDSADSVSETRTDAGRQEPSAEDGPTDSRAQQLQDELDEMDRNAPAPLTRDPSRSINLDRDSLLDAIGKSGGISQRIAEAEGFDPADMKGASRPRVGAQPFRKTSERSMDDMAEAMQELGYLNQRDPDELMERISEEMRGGDPTYSSQGRAQERLQEIEDFNRTRDAIEEELMTGRRPGQEDDLELETQTESSLAEDDAVRTSREADAEARRRQEEQRFDADREVDDFTLTGSDRQADRAMARGQEDMFAGPTNQREREAQDEMVDELADALGEPSPDRSIGGVQFYSGLPLDKLWDGLKSLGSGAHNLYRRSIGNEDDFQVWATRTKDLIEDLRNRRKNSKEGPGSASDALARVYHASVGDMDGHNRAIGRTYGSKLVERLSDVLHRPAGAKSDGANQATYSIRMNRGVSKYARDLKKVADAMGRNGIGRNNREAQDRIYKMLENPRIPRRGAEGKIADEAETMLRNLYEYQKARGVDVGYVEGYVPRWADRSQVISKPKKFQTQAAKAYRKMGDDQRTAQERAAALYDSIVQDDAPAFGNDPQQQAGGLDGPDPLKPRKLSREAAKELNEFWQRDLEGSLSNYMLTAIKRAEIADTDLPMADGSTMKLGNRMENWPEFRNHLREQVPEMSAEHLQDLENNMAAGLGVHGNQRGQTISSIMRTLGGLSMLDRVAISALPELSSGAMRATTGNVATDMGTQLRNLRMIADDSMRNAVGKMTGGAVGKNADLDEAYDLAETLNTIAGDTFSYVMQARVMGDDPANRTTARINDNFYRNVGLTQITDYSRVLSLRHGKRFVQHMAKDMLSGGRRANRAGVFMRELGIPRGKEQQFADWYGRQFGGGEVTAQKLRQLRQSKSAEDQEFAESLDTALNTFVDQSIQRPDASTRPRWANHPVGAMIWQLNNFMWSFQKNVIQRTFRTASNDELDKMQRAGFAAGQLGGYAMLYGLARLGGEVRDFISEESSDREPTPKTEAYQRERAASYAGLFGRADMLLQTFAGLRYERSIADTVVGPAASSYMGMLQSQVSAMTNDADTNTAERTAWDETHRMILTPAIQAALTMVPQTGAISRGVAMAGSVSGARATREPFTEAMAGPEDPELRERRLSEPLTAPISEGMFGLTGNSESDDSGGGRGAGRSTGRSSGRSAGRSTGR